MPWTAICTGKSTVRLPGTIQPLLQPPSSCCLIETDAGQIQQYHPCLHETAKKNQSSRPPTIPRPLPRSPRPRPRQLRHDPGGRGRQVARSSNLTPVLMTRRKKKSPHTSLHSPKHGPQIPVPFVVVGRVGRGSCLIRTCIARCGKKTMFFHDTTKVVSSLLVNFVLRLWPRHPRVCFVFVLSFRLPP